MLTIFISIRNFKLCCPSNSIALQIVLTEKKKVGEIIVLRNPVPGNTVIDLLVSSHKPVITTRTTRSRTDNRVVYLKQRVVAGMHQNAVCRARRSESVVAVALESSSCCQTDHRSVITRRVPKQMMLGLSAGGYAAAVEDGHAFDLGDAHD